MAKFPILYTLFSEALDAPSYVVVVDKPGSFKAYRAGEGKKVYESSDDYDKDGASVFDEPKRGVTLLPTGTRNILKNRIIVSEGASSEQISSLLDEIASVTPEAIDKVYDDASDGS